jgi:hypothetical protein
MSIQRSFNDESQPNILAKIEFTDIIGGETEKTFEIAIFLQSAWAEMASEEVIEFVISFTPTNDDNNSVFNSETFSSLGWISPNAIGQWCLIGNKEFNRASNELITYYYESILALKNIPDREICIVFHLPDDRQRIFDSYPKVHSGYSRSNNRGIIGDFSDFKVTNLTLKINEFMLNYIHEE